MDLLVVSGFCGYELEGGKVIWFRVLRYGRGGIKIKGFVWCWKGLGLKGVGWNVLLMKEY